MEGTIDDAIPQWKKELIIRIRNKNKWYSTVEQLLAGTPRNASAAVGCAGQQPNITCSSASVPVVNSNDVVTVKCNEDSLKCDNTKMVKERVFVDHNQINNYLYETDNDMRENGDDSNSVDSSSSEELHYGPGIVNKLKNKYLSLTLRENNVKTRPSILPIRKATSLEHLLDEDLPNGKTASTNTRTYNSRWKENNAKNASNRYNTKRGDLKRARSVETISRTATEESNELINDVRVKHKSLHEDMLIIREGNDKLSGKTFDNKTLEITTETKPFSNAIPHIINRPKRIAPVMSEKEKPPVDVVKQTKKLFEGKAEQRTKPPQQTGEVAAKVASYKNIIGQVKNNKKPPIKEKPVLPENKKPIRSPENAKLQKPSKLPIGTIENGWKKEDKSPSPDVASIRSVSSPIPDVSRINSPNKEDVYNRQTRNGSSLSETPDLILHSSPIKNPSSPTFKIIATDNFLKAEVLHSNNNNFKLKHCREKGALSPTKNDIDDTKTISQESRVNIRQAGNTTTFNLSSSTNFRSHLPIVHSDTSPPIKNAHTKTVTNNHLVNSVSKPTWPAQVNLTPQEIQKNNINKAKTLEQNVALCSPLFVKCDEVKKVEVPKATLPKLPKEQNSIVFKFTDRKDVPDYVGNDGKIRSAGKIEKPKVGEGGIILLPGAAVDESFTDDDDEWMLSLEGPPSPCDVVFINDNVLIDGRSSLNQKNKKLKMRIKFMESLPEIFEYPSEASLLDEVHSPSRGDTSPGHVVPNISGSSLANYIPKAGATEDFQLGITRTVPTQSIVETKNSGAYVEAEMQEIEEPILFSAETNSDMLF